MKFSIDTAPFGRKFECVKARSEGVSSTCWVDVAMSGLGLERLTIGGGLVVGWRKEGLRDLKVFGKSSASWRRMEKTYVQSEVREDGKVLLGPRMTMTSQLWVRSSSAWVGVIIHWTTRAVVMGSMPAFCMATRKADGKVDGEVDGRKEMIETVIVIIAASSTILQRIWAIVGKMVEIDSFGRPRRSLWCGKEPVRKWYKVCITAHSAQFGSALQWAYGLATAFLCYKRRSSV
jgi:hypothetical protein